jgi:hypothetical protein
MVLGCYWWGYVHISVRLKECPDFGVSLFIECRPFFGSQRVISSLGFVVTLAADVAAFMSDEVQAARQALPEVLAVFVVGIFYPVVLLAAPHPKRTNKAGLTDWH